MRPGRRGMPSARRRAWAGAGGRVAEAPGETWHAIGSALRLGWRGLPGGASLARLLDRGRGVRNRRDPPDLTEGQILAWAWAHRRRTGAWPDWRSGPIPEAPGETWGAVNTALAEGRRGLPPGGSLFRLLRRYAGGSAPASGPPLTVGQVLAWAEGHFRRTGLWPNVRAGRVPEAPGETWGRIDRALRLGLRGLPGGDSLPGLLRAGILRAALARPGNVT